MSPARPDFFLAGAAKCGTTSLYAWLGQHPDIFLSTPKEPHFFVAPRPHATLRLLARRIADRDRYLALFSEAPVVGEGSTLYLWAPESPELIARDCPDARFIVSLRDPVERAFSSYLNSRREGTEKRELDEAFREEAALSIRERNELRQPLHLDPGFYSRGLRRLFDRFGRERVLVLLFEELVAAPRAGLKRCFRFLGVDENSAERLRTSARNPYRKPRSITSARLLASGRLRAAARRWAPRALRRRVYDLLVKEDEKPRLPPETRARLVDLYRPEAEACRELLGCDPPWPWV